MVGDGFRLNSSERELYIARRASNQNLIRRYWIGDDVKSGFAQRYVLDAFGTDVGALSEYYPDLYQHLVDNVLPHRSQNNDKGFRERWWLFGRPRPEMRASLEELSRYIVTSETSKHRFFIFLQWPNDLIDGSAIAIASADAFVLGVLSSECHVIWSTSIGGRMGVGNDPRYQNLITFDPFPFPSCDDAIQARIRALGEELDAFRKARLAEHPGLTLTGMYNVLKRLKAGVALDAKEKVIHERGLVSVLLDIHRRLDAAVADAYGWPADLPAEAILERLVALNRERAEEEKGGLVRWLRPEYQAPKAKAVQPVQEEMAVGEAIRVAGTAAWPKTLPDQFQALTRLLDETAQPIELRQATKRFKGAKSERVEELLQTLVALGRARALPGRHYGR